MISEFIVSNNEDLKLLLDRFMDFKTNDWWNSFYNDKERDIPFNISVPDENLIQYVEVNNIQKGRALDIGCGNGRNSYYLANQGFEVTAIDFSAEAINIAKEKHSHPGITFYNNSFFDLQYSRNT